GVDLDVIHDDLTGNRRTQPDLAVNGRRRQAFHAFFKDEAADLAIVVAAHHFGPDDEHVGDGRIGDPHFGAADFIAAVGLDRAGVHAAGVGAVVGFGQAEAAYPFTACQLGQVFLLLLFAAEFVDGHHDQRRLHAHHGAVARVDALDFARDQAVADIVQPCAAVFFGDGGAQQAQFTHFAENR